MASEKLKIQVDLEGIGYDDKWPLVHFLVDDKIHDEQITVQGEQSFIIETLIDKEKDKNHTFCILYNNKSYKDVVLGPCGKVQKDKKVRIKNISFNNIDLGHNIVYEQGFVHVVDPWYKAMAAQCPEAWPNPRKHELDLSWNSEFVLHFTSPVYLWMLKNL